MTGPRAAQGGYDYMMQGLAGWMSLTGDPDGPPTKSGLSLVDLSGGYASAIAVLAGLWRARREGTGCDCDVSLLDTALHELMYVGTWAASRGYTPPRRRNSAHPSIVPFQNFGTEDGWIVENEGVPPDIEIEQTPADVIAGRDPQLEKAIALALDELKKHPPATPARPPYKKIGR